MARFLVQFALRRASDTVLEPCFGEGVFLHAAAERCASRGGDPARQITGVEIHRPAWEHARDGLTGPGRLAAQRLVLEDFFACDAATLGRFDAVVGNPPFIRYQRFTGAPRRRALGRALEAGVRLPSLTSSWAPFIVHATSFLKAGGRLAMVAPAELCHASYARPVLDLLARRFASVRVLTFGRRLFPDLSEDTVLLLCDGYGSGCGALSLVPLASAAELPRADADILPAIQVVPDTQDVVRLIAYLLPAGTRELYATLATHPDVQRLGGLASSGIGYVTGHNAFFHLTPAEAAQRRIPREVLAPAACRASWLRGLIFRRSDWEGQGALGKKTLLLRLPPGETGMSTAVKHYLLTGVRARVPEAYKCRVRRPWYVVPHVFVPDLFLTYMANRRPALMLNRAGVVAPNTLLCLRLARPRRHLAEAMAAGWWTSLAALSAEIEGHSLGAGMLKLEPGEASRVLLPVPATRPGSGMATRSRRVEPGAASVALIDAIRAAGPRPPDSAGRGAKKNYAERLSNQVALTLAAALRGLGLNGCQPDPSGGRERQFAGGIGAKKVDVSYATEEGGLILGVSVKSISFADQRTGNYQKNLTNRRGDLLAEATTLHQRFPYAVIGGLFLFDEGAERDGTNRRPSTVVTAHEYFRAFDRRASQANAVEEFEALGILLIRAWEPAACRYHDVGLPRAERPISTFLGRLLERVAERNPDRFRYAGCRLSRRRAPGSADGTDGE